MSLIPSPNGPIGPFFHFALTPDESGGVMTNGNTRGEKIRLLVRVIDSAGTQITNAMLELWQADASGIYNHPDDPRCADADPGFKGFGRYSSDEEGICIFDTVMPGPVGGPDGTKQAPHINVNVFMPGLLRRVVTRIYFEGDPANESDPVLNLIPPERRFTLLAHRGEQANEWLFDMHMCGEKEIVFFDI